MPLTVQQRTMAEQRAGIYKMDRTGIASKDGNPVGIPSHHKIRILQDDATSDDELLALQIVVYDLRSSGGRRMLDEGTRIEVIRRK